MVSCMWEFCYKILIVNKYIYGCFSKPNHPLVYGLKSYSCHKSVMYLSCIVFLAARGEVNVGETRRRLEIKEHDDICKNRKLWKFVIAECAWNYHHLIFWVGRHLNDR